MCKVNYRPLLFKIIKDNRIDSIIINTTDNSMNYFDEVKYMYKGTQNYKFDWSTNNEYTNLDFKVFTNIHDWIKYKSFIHINFSDL